MNRKWFLVLLVLQLFYFQLKAMRERAATRLALALERERKRERDRVADLCLKGWLVTNTTAAFVQLTQLNQSLAFPQN